MSTAEKSGRKGGEVQGSEAGKHWGESGRVVLGG